MKFFASFFVSKYSLRGLAKAYFWLITNQKQIKLWRAELSNIKQVDEKFVFSFVSGKIFNGNNVLEKLINLTSVNYCKFLNIPVIEIIKSR
jgi:hypothetical protein